MPTTTSGCRLRSVAGSRSSTRSTHSSRTSVTSSTSLCPPRTNPHAGEPATATWATSGWLAAHDCRPSPVAMAVESPVTTMRTGRESPAGSGGDGVRVDGGRRRRRERGRGRGRGCRRRRGRRRRRCRSGRRRSRSSTTESTGARVAASADCIHDGVVSSGTTAMTSARAEHAATPASAGRGSPPVRIGRSRRRNDTTARATVSTDADGELVDHHEHGPVEEVDAVADRAEGDERAPGEQAAQRGRDLQADDDGRRRQGEHREPALVRRAGPGRPGHGRPGDDARPADAEPRDGRRKRPRRPPTVEDHGDEGADEDLAQPRRGRPVGRITRPTRRRSAGRRGRRRR